MAFLLAAYALGPMLVARWFLSRVVPLKSLAQSRSEQISQGIFWAIVPGWVAYFARHWGPCALPPNSKVDVFNIFSALSSETYFDKHQPELYEAFSAFLWANWCILLRLYCAVFVIAFLTVGFLYFYGALRSSMRKNPITSSLFNLLATLVVPSISEWHVQLSSLLLKSHQMSLDVDVLTRSGTLYQGSFQEKTLAADGSLHAITLNNPKRFLRQEYLDQKAQAHAPDPQLFWKAIPSDAFIIMAADIATLNIRYVPSSAKSYAKFADVAARMQELAHEVAKGPQNQKG